MAWKMIAIIIGFKPDNLKLDKDFKKVGPICGNLLKTAQTY
jgi:hypothetical protein